MMKDRIKRKTANKPRMKNYTSKSSFPKHNPPDTADSVSFPFQEHSAFVFLSDSQQETDKLMLDALSVKSWILRTMALKEHSAHPMLLLATHTTPNTRAPLTYLIAPLSLFR